MKKLAQLIDGEAKGTNTRKDQALLDEARKRGLVGTPKDSVSDTLKAISSQHIEALGILGKIIKDPRRLDVPEMPTPVFEMTAPVVNVQVPEQKTRKLRVKVIRGSMGYIEALEIEQVKED